MNVAAWSSTPNLLLAYSGDAGTVAVGPGDGGEWTIQPATACLDPHDADAVGDEVASRLQIC